MKKFGIIFVIVFIALVIWNVFSDNSVNEFAQSDLLEKISNRGVLKVGVNPDSRPYAFYDEKGVLTGFDIDFAKQIASYIVKNPDRVEFIPVTPANRLIKASTGDVDIVISTVTITPQRKEVVSFSIPYATAGQAILVKSNSAVKSVTDLSGQTVGVIFGTTAEKNMKKLVPSAHLRGFRNYNEAYNALKNGEIAAVTSDDTILSRYAADDSLVKLLPRRYSSEPYGIAFKKGETSKQLKISIDYAIKDLRRKNIMTRLEKKWNI